MKRFLICVLALSLLFSASASNSGVRHETARSLSAQAEAYYTGEYTMEVLSSLAGSASASSAEAWSSPLCAALHRLMTETQTGLPPYAETLLAFPQTDSCEGSSEPLRFYCDDSGAYNREQVWAELHGAYYQEGAGADLHHLRPADKDANLVRGNMVFGNVRNRYSDYAAWPETGEPVFWYVPDWGGGMGLVEVRDSVKGDVARILLYVWAAYGAADGANLNLWTELPEWGEGLSYSDGSRVIESLDTLLEWMALDPVDTWELGRNDVVQGLQGNRNVFIDYPELAFCLFERPIPDMPTPSGWAHGRLCNLSAAAEPAESGTVRVTASALGGWEVTAVPAPGWTVCGWTLDPADAAQVTRDGNNFTLRALQADCTLTVQFLLEDPCALGHSWDAGTVTQAPGCETAGERLYRCSVCAATRGEPIPALGHDWFDSVVPPGCTRPGYTVECCRRCQAENEIPGDPPLGHDWDAGTVTREPTQSLPGERTYRCSRCLDIRTEEIPFRFADVQDESSYYFTAVYWALRHNPPITAGTSATHFSPHQSCTRAQVMTFLWRAYGSPEPEAGENPFVDVADTAYYYMPVLWAVEQRISAGTSPVTFSPGAVCTRAQIVTFLWAAAGRPAASSRELPFTDVPEDAYYRPAVCWALERGISSGTAADSFSPELVCTRAQVVTMLWKLLRE